METRSCTRLTVPYEANYQAKQVLGAGHRPRLCVRRRAGSRACGPWSRQPGRRSSRVSERVSERAIPRLREQQRVPSTGRLRTVNSSIPSANGPRSRPCVSFMVDWSSSSCGDSLLSRYIVRTISLYRSIRVPSSSPFRANRAAFLSWGAGWGLGLPFCALAFPFVLLDYILRFSRHVARVLTLLYFAARATANGDDPATASETTKSGSDTRAIGTHRHIARGGRARLIV